MSEASHDDILRQLAESRVRIEYLIEEVEKARLEGLQGRKALEVRIQRLELAENSNEARVLEADKWRHRIYETMRWILPPSLAATLVIYLLGGDQPPQ